MRVWTWASLVFIGLFNTLASRMQTHRWMSSSVPLFNCTVFIRMSFLLHLEVYKIPASGWKFCFSACDLTIGWFAATTDHLCFIQRPSQVFKNMPCTCATHRTWPRLLSQDSRMGSLLCSFYKGFPKWPGEFWYPSNWYCLLGRAIPEQ